MKEHEEKHPLLEEMLMHPAKEQPGHEEMKRAEHMRHSGAMHSHDPYHTHPHKNK